MNTFNRGFLIVVFVCLAGCVTPPGGTAQDAARSAAPGKRIKECRNCPELAVIPAGSFLMGSPESESERRENERQRRVTFTHSFAMATTPITWDQWEACVRDRWCDGAAIDTALRQAPDGSRNPNYRDYGRGMRPAVGMSWYDAQNYVGWLNWTTTTTATSACAATMCAADSRKAATCG
jgi:formylglycine-generating enzyme required for sulfatase activity